jgi:ribonuclease J
VVARSAQDGKIMGEPEILFRGMAHAGDLDELAKAARDVVVELLESAEMRQVSDVGLVKNRVHDVLQKFLRKEADRRPMVLPVIVEV